MNNKVNIEQAIALVETGIGSIYSKEDVISLINRLELPTVTEPLITNQVRYEVLKSYEEEITREAVKQLSRVDELFDYDSAEFEIDYGNRLRLTDVTLNEREIESSIESAFENTLEALEELIRAEQIDLEPLRDTQINQDDVQVAETE